MDDIFQFEGETRFLSNFWPCPVTVWGTEFPSAEHAYQAAKTRDPAARDRVAAMPTPGAAKRAGRTLELREDWDRARKPAMLVVVLTKFTQNPVLGLQLAATRHCRLVEGNHWHDNFWGSCDCERCGRGFEDVPWHDRGMNYLGRVLMAVRDAVRAD